MRKVNALQILAAAIAVVPGTVFAAGDETVPARPVGMDRPASQSPDLFGSVGRHGQFSLTPAVNLNGGPDDNGSFTWVGPDGGTWQVPTNWNPNGVPDGIAANAFFTEQAGGAVITLNGPVTLNSLNFSDPMIVGIAGPVSGATQTITMAGGAAVNTTRFASERFPSTGKYFGTAIGLPAAAPDPARPVRFGGTVGLTLNGPAGPSSVGATQPGAIAIRFDNVYSGNTTLNANTRFTVLPGASLDGALGTSGNLVLNGGEFWAQIDNGTLNRQVVVNAGGGTISVGADSASSTQTFNGNVSGAGPLVIDNTFGGNGVFTANNTYNGALRIMGAGTNILSGGGAFASATSIRNAGTLILAGAGANRLPDAGALQLNGGALRIENGGGQYTENVGSTQLLSATPAIVIRPGGGTVYNGGTLNRTPGTGLEVRGTNLGATPGNDVANVNFTNAAGLMINNVIPWAYGSNDDPFFVGAENDETEFMNAGPNGLRPLSAGPGYIENTFAGAGPTSNVRLRAGVNGQAGNNPNYTVPGNITINSLTLAPGFDESSNGVGGIFLNGAPGTTITLTSGALLSSSSGFNGSAINSGVGNTVNVNLNFGAAEGVLNSPGALTINGNLSGTGGVTKTGVRTLFMNGTGSTYTGTTTLTGFNRHTGNLLAGQPSAYGSSTSDILLVPFERIQDDPGLGATGINFVSFGPDAAAGVTTMTRGLRVVAGGNGELLSSLLRNFSGATFNMNGQVTVDAGADLIFQGLNPGVNQFDVGGNIVGGGHAGTSGVAGSTLTVVLRGNNTFSGGFDFAFGDVVAETNSAFGTGLITVSAGTSTVSSSGARSIGNNWLFTGGFIDFGNNFTMTGNGALGGSILSVSGANTATFSGVLSEGSSGGSLFKEGSGTLVLSGNNSFGGQLNVGNGSIAGGMVVLQSNSAGGADIGVVAANAGENTVGLRGNIITNGKPFVLRGSGIGGLGGLRNLSGNNTWGGTVLVQDLAPTPGGPVTGTVGVDAGSTLTLARSVFVSGDTNSTFTFEKVGTGQLNVGAETFTATRSGGATSSFQGSIVGVDHVAVQSGRLAMSPSSGPNRHVSHVGSLSTAGSSQFDLTNNALVVDYASAGPTPFADIRNEIISGYAGGAWTGPGIITSQGNTNFGVGYAEASVVLTFAGSPPDALFLGDVVDNTSVLARYTRYGDANLDGTVNLADFNRLAAGFGNGTRWDQGDFDYNGIVNLADFNRLAANFGQSAAGTEVTPEDWANLASAIPEPSSLGLAAVAGLAMLKRRRRYAR
jgi:autotransporter-associated beta strand protein